jgi:hypothetical protein
MQINKAWMNGKPVFPHSIQWHGRHYGNQRRLGRRSSMLGVTRTHLDWLVRGTVCLGAHERLCPGQGQLGAGGSRSSLRWDLSPSCPHFSDTTVCPTLQPSERPSGTFEELAFQLQLESVIRYSIGD